MKILFVTGKKAFPLISKYASENVHVCRIDVAALISPGMLLKELSKRDLDGFSMIIVPGYVKGDVSAVGKKLGIRCVKGPKHIADIPRVLEAIDTVELSPLRPADDVLNMKEADSAKAELDSALSSKNGMRIGRKNPVYLGTFPRIIAEISDAPLLDKSEISRIARHYQDCGAGVIDVGMTAGEDNSDKIEEILKNVRRSTNLPLSIDTADEDEIIAGVDAGVDLILSIDRTNKKVVKSIDVPVVVVPRNSSGVPEKAADRVRLLEGTIKYVGKHCPVIADPLLQPLNTGFVSSLEAYIKFREKHPGIPMMLGAGNVTEMTDADSVGMNALLAGVASELNLELIFTTEASVKTRGAVSELSNAVKMMHLSKTRRQPPKDLGIDMLLLKDKRSQESVPETGVKLVSVREKPSAREQTTFRIYLDGKNIVAVCYAKGKPVRGFRGKSAGALYGEICSMKLVGCGHAAYLGKELAKAEIALKIGKNYVQDEELFKLKV